MPPSAWQHNHDRPSQSTLRTLLFSVLLTPGTYLLPTNKPTIQTQPRASLMLLQISGRLLVYLPLGSIGRCVFHLLCISSVSLFHPHPDKYQITLRLIHILSLYLHCVFIFIFIFSIRFFFLPYFIVRS